METIAIVLRVGEDRVEEFERGFREHELPVWEDLRRRGLLVRASISRLEIATPEIAGAVQYLVVTAFATGEGHHAHDEHPGFRAWNEMADAYQVDWPLAFGGETSLKLGA